MHYIPIQPPSIATATNIDTLLVAADKEENTEPSEALQDKVHFIFNNLSTSNLEQKVAILIIRVYIVLGRVLNCHID